MSLPILLSTDFLTGSTLISQNAQTTTQLTAYIAEFEDRYIKDLLNDEMFIAMRDGTHAKYTALTDGVDWTDDDDTVHRLTGLKTALLQFVYYHFVSDAFMSTPVGNTKNAAELSTMVANGNNQQIVFKRFNEGINYYNECRDFVNFYQNMDEVITGSTESPSGTYAITVASTLYLDTGDTITLGGVNYVVSSVVVDTGFTITGDAGLSLNGLTYTYTPFYLPNLTLIKDAWL